LKGGKGSYGWCETVDIVERLECPEATSSNYDLSNEMKGFNQKEDNSSSEKLKGLLKTLFQFDCSELDFGIYRIMNYKRKEIEDFIEKDLIQAVEKEFERYKTQSGQELAEKIGEKKKEIEKLEKELGEKILKNGDIADEFKDKPFAKEFVELTKQLV